MRTKTLGKDGLALIWMGKRNRSTLSSEQLHVVTHEREILMKCAHKYEVHKLTKKNRKAEEVNEFEIEVKKEVIRSKEME